MNGNATCGACDRRCISNPDGLCGDCRQARAQLTGDYSAYAPKLGLTGGQWIGHRGIVKWTGPTDRTQTA